MNKQTRSLRKEGKSLKFNHGADFSHLSGRERAAHPEFQIVDQVSRLRQRKSAHRYFPDEHMGLPKQTRLFYGIR